MLTRHSGTRANGPGIAAILWDNDGVLSDTEVLFFAANRNILAREGIALTHAQYVAWYLEDYRGAWHFLRARGYSELRIGQLRIARDEEYMHLLAAAPRLCFPGVETLLAKLAPKVVMGIVTASIGTHLALVHRHNRVLDHFDHIFAKTEGQRPKPHPDTYLHALDKMGLSADVCIAVEDTPRGLAAARAAGLRCIVLRSELLSGYVFEGAYRVVASHNELGVVLDTLLEQQQLAPSRYL